jgi:hypothetical protein
VDPDLYRRTEHLERLDELRAWIRRLMATGSCGSADNPHMWVTTTNRSGATSTVCAKCGASG